jgi:hypothetical protein
MNLMNSMSDTSCLYDCCLERVETKSVEFGQSGRSVREPDFNLRSCRRDKLQQTSA